MNSVKCILVASVPGARSDFVAGWLGTLANFVDNEWKIDPVTGMSSGNQRLTKILDKNIKLTLAERLAEYNMMLDPTAQLTFAGSVHGYNLAHQLPWKDRNKVFQVLSIRVPNDTEVMNKIRWDFFCKSYLSLQYDWALLLNKPGLDVAELAQTEFYTYHEFKNFNIPYSINADYLQLFAPGGSRYLCNLLNLDADDKNHDAWDSALTKADSPEEVIQFGKVWRRADHSAATIA